MSGRSTIPEPPSPAAKAEAAAWVARLQGPNRDTAAEQDFRRWLEADPAHVAAFDRATQVWEGIGGAAAGMKVRRPERARMPLAASLAAVALVAGAGGWLAFKDPVYETRIGEQRSVRLDDGSLVALNTNTKVVVRYSKGRRDLRLLRGEAQFDVAKNPHRPFIVTAEGQQVRALGTSFVVRDDGSRVSVTLLEGKVTVTPVRADHPKAVSLTPGERVQIAERAAPRVDRPPLQAVTAWRSGQVLLDDTSLGSAVAEMNRYSDKPIEIEDPQIAALRVTGIFRSGESQSFARTVAAQYGLTIIERPDRTVLAQPPAA